MALPLTFIISTVTGLMQGPVSKLLEAYVSDLELRRKLQAELESSLVSHLGKSLELQEAVILAEIQSGNWLTRSWRPMLMFLLMAFLVLVGFLLPLADLLAGKAIPFNPRWQTLPDGFWDFLGIGVGGYVGGRSLEKVTENLLGRTRDSRKK
jgi:hypothetical protein